MTATNAATAVAQATARVTGCLGVEAEPGVPAPVELVPVANTGVPLLSVQLWWALGMLVLGGFMTVLATGGRDRRRR